MYDQCKGHAWERLLAITFCFLIYGAGPVFSQIPAATSINGVVIEPFSGEPLEFVHVLLFSETGETEFDGRVTNKQGEFSFTNIPLGTYYLQVSFIGFETHTTDKFRLDTPGKTVQLKKIELHLSEGMLDDIEVFAEKPTYSLTLNRKVYNVEKDIQGQTGSLTEILQNLPSVSVGVDGVVSLRGTSNITFFINGRPSALFRSNNAGSLQAIPAVTIESIEVITNPSARYRPDGAGGIINIVLKDEVLEGWNGTLLGNIGNSERYTAGLSLSYGKEDVLFRTNYGFRHAKTPQDILDERVSFGEIIPNVLQNFKSISDAVFNQESHIFTAELEFPVGENSAMEIGGELLANNEENIATSDITSMDRITGITSALVQDRTYESTELEYEVGIGFETEFEDEENTLAFEIVYGHYDEKEDNIYDEFFTSPSVLNLKNHNLIEKGGPTLELLVDYVKPINENARLEAGYLGEFIKDDIRILGEDFKAAENLWINNPGKTNHFKFSQNIHAFYGTYGLSFDKWNLLGGLRAESTSITSDLLTTDQEIPNDYFSLYPSVEIGYQLKEYRNLVFRYGRRVNRADSDEHNPFPEYEDPRRRDAGNPLVRPENIHSLELGFSYQVEKFSFLSTLYHRQKNDGFTEISMIVEDSILQTSFTNLAKERLTGLEIIFNRHLINRLNFTISANGYHNDLDASNLGIADQKSTYSWDAKLALNLNLSNALYLQTNAHYFSSRLTAQGNFDPLFLLNLGVRYSLPGDRGSLIFTVSDVFASLEFESVVDTPELYQRTSYGRNQQIFYLGFSYNFGNIYSIKNKNLEFEDVIE